MTLVVLFACGFAAGVGCSSDPETPLGLEFVLDSLIVSRPGDVYQDTITVTTGDTLFVVSANSLGKQGTLMLGQKDDFEKWPVLKFDFSSAPSKPIKTAELVLRVATSQTDTLGAQFYRLLTPYSESDSLLKSLDLGSVIQDDQGGVDREISKSGLEAYALETQLVEDWIDGTDTHNGIAVVLDDTTTTFDLILGSRDDEEFDPRLKIVYQDDEVLNLPPTDDGTFVQSLTTTVNLGTTDGLVRRSLIPVPIDSVDETTLVHEAKLTLSIVPGTSLGGDFTMTVYAPNSADPSDPAILEGTLVDVRVVDPDESKAIFRIRDILVKFISGEKENNGLIVQFTSTGSGVRELQFYSTAAADTLKPSISFTVSDSPTFP